MSKFLSWFKNRKGEARDPVVVWDQLKHEFFKLNPNGNDLEVELKVLDAVREYEKYGASVAEGLLAELGGERFDEETFELKPWLSDDVWHFDYEAIEDHGAYVAIIENCIRISKGALNITRVADFVDIEDEKIWISFVSDKQKKKFDLKVDNDWTDPHVFSILNNVLKETNSSSRFAQHDLGQDCLLVCKPERELEKINKQFQLKFFVIEG